MRSYRLTKFQTLLLICALALLARFYQLGSNPPSIDWDEASNAYNAYSILKTGRDEYGNFMPISNRSFNDYKPSFYMYADILAVRIFGLNEVAARLPSALAGILAVATVYCLTVSLFKNTKVALFAALFIAISPWHLQFSRAGFEANIGLLLQLLCFTLFFCTLNNKTTITKLLILLSGIFVGASFYTYHSQRVIVPLLLTSTIILYRRDFFSLSKKIIVSFFLIIMITIVPLGFVPREAFTNRFQSTTQTVLSPASFFNNYLANFSLNYLFIKGDYSFRHHLEGFGLLYIFQLPLIIAGLYFLAKRKARSSIFLLTWLFTSALPSAFGNENPHAVRTFSMVFALCALTAVGLVNLPIKTRHNISINIILIPTVIFSFFIYLENYYNHYPHDQASHWQYGYKEAVLKTQEVEEQFNKIIVNSTIEQGYIFWLFYLAYDPQSYQKTGTNGHFGKYYFQDLQAQNNKDLLVAKNVPQDFEVLETIYYPNGIQAVQIGHPK